MSSSKLYFLMVCLLCLALPALAEKPNDNRPFNSDSRSSESSRGSLQKIERIGGKNLDEHIKDLSHPDPSVRSRALMCIPYFGPDAASAVPEVVKRLKDFDASPRIKAIIALRMMYIPVTQREPVIKALGVCLVDPNSQHIHRYEAAKTLMRFGPLTGQERAAVMDLVPNIGMSTNYELREISIDALMTAGPDPERGPDTRVTEALIVHADSFREHAEQVRYKAIMALGALGRPQDPKKLEQVLTVLKARGQFNSSNKIIRIWTHVSIMALEDKVYEKELAAIAKLLEDSSPLIRVQAATALGALRDKAHAYVGSVCDVVERETDPLLLPTLVMSLGRMGNNGNRVIKTLIRVTEYEERKYVEAVIAACSALKEIGVNDPTVIQALEKVLKHPALDDYQKDMLKKLIEDVKHPPKKAVKEAPKALDKGVGVRNKPGGR